MQRHSPRIPSVFAYADRDCHGPDHDRAGRGRQHRRLQCRLRRHAAPTAVSGTGPARRAVRRQRSGEHAGCCAPRRSTISRGQNVRRARKRSRRSWAPMSRSPIMGSQSACPAAPSPRRCSACSACRRSPVAAFAPKTSGRGLARVAVVAEALWRRRFGGDPAIVGQSITLNGERHQVIGVVPRAFREVGRAQIAVRRRPADLRPAHHRSGARESWQSRRPRGRPAASWRLAGSRS